MEAEYLIRKGGFFYRPESQGYTPHVEEAGLFTLEEAIKLTMPNGPHGPRDQLSYHHRGTFPGLERQKNLTKLVSEELQNSVFGCCVPSEREANEAAEAIMKLLFDSKIS